MMRNHVLFANYPNGTGIHDEPFVVWDDGKSIGFGRKLDKFMNDCTTKSPEVYINKMWNYAKKIRCLIIM